VKDSGNDLEWIKGFKLVLNALDNRGECGRSHKRATHVELLLIQMLDPMSIGFAKQEAYLLSSQVPPATSARSHPSLR
jgi:hypothetical protein